MAAKYFQLLKQGLARPEDILDYEDSWHDGPSAESLHAFLGMTHAQYLRWMREGNAYFNRFYNTAPARRKVAAKK